MFGSYSNGFIVAQIVAGHMSMLFEQTLDDVPAVYRSVIRSDRDLGCYPVTFNKVSGLCFVSSSDQFGAATRHVYIFEHPSSDNIVLVRARRAAYPDYLPSEEKGDEYIMYSSISHEGVAQDALNFLLHIEN